MADAAVCLDDYQRLAKSILSDPVFDYISGAAGRQVTLKDNVESFDSWRIRPRVLRDVTQRDLSTTILGQKIAFPVCLAPTAMNGLVHNDAECATAEGAYAAGVGFTLSMHSNKSIEDVAAAATPNSLRFFQLCILSDKQLTEQLVSRAETHGYKALVLTADKPVYGVKSSIAKTLPPGLLMRNFLPRPSDGNTDESVAHPQNVKDNFNLNFTWDELKWLIGITKLPVILKGILTGEDAKLAVDCGVSGIIVSNHGGRQLDTVVSSIDALPEVLLAVNGRCEVYMDGGVRHGIDIFKALALGAKAVFIGRPALFALACNGTEGVQQMLGMLRDEFSATLAFAGCKAVKDIQRDMVVHARSYKSM